MVGLEVKAVRTDEPVPCQVCGAGGDVHVFIFTITIKKGPDGLESWTSTIFSFCVHHMASFAEQFAEQLEGVLPDGGAP